MYEAATAVASVSNGRDRDDRSAGGSRIRSPARPVQSRGLCRRDEIFTLGTIYKRAAARTVASMAGSRTVFARVAPTGTTSCARDPDGLYGLSADPQIVSSRPRVTRTQYGA